MENIMHRHLKARASQRQQNKVWCGHAYLRSSLLTKEGMIGCAGCTLRLFC